MADIENAIHDPLIATAEPDEEANRRCRLRFSVVLSLVLGAMAAGGLLTCLYYGLKNPMIPLWALVYLLGILALLIGAPFYHARHLVWKIVCEICNPEKERQIDG